jgi:hypothetical protein
MDCYSAVWFHNLEHRNVCAEPERQRNSLGNSLQFPLRRRPTATNSQCDSRLLQDGLADDCCDPGACRRGDTNSDANCQPYADAYGNIHTDTDTDPNGNSNTYCYANSYSHADSYRHGNCYPDANTNTDGDTNPTAYTYTKSRPVTKGSSHSGAETLTRLIGEKCFVVGCQ